MYGKIKITHALLSIANFSHRFKAAEMPQEFKEEILSIKDPTILESLSKDLMPFLKAGYDKNVREDNDEKNPESAFCCRYISKL